MCRPVLFLYICIKMHINICIYIYIYIIYILYIYILYLSIYLSIYLYIYIHTCICICICIYIYIYDTSYSYSNLPKIFQHIPTRHRSKCPYGHVSNRPQPPRVPCLHLPRRSSQGGLRLQEAAARGYRAAGPKGTQQDLLGQW